MPASTTRGYPATAISTKAIARPTSVSRVRSASRFPSSRRRSAAPASAYSRVPTPLRPNSVIPATIITIEEAVTKRPKSPTPRWRVIRRTIAVISSWLTTNATARMAPPRIALAPASGRSSGSNDGLAPTASTPMLTALARSLGDAAARSPRAYRPRLGPSTATVPPRTAPCSHTEPGRTPGGDLHAGRGPGVRRAEAAGQGGDEQGAQRLLEGQRDGAGVRVDELADGGDPGVEVMQHRVQVRLEHRPGVRHPQRPARAAQQRRADLLLQPGQRPGHAGLGDRFQLADLGDRGPVGHLLKPAQRIGIHIHDYNSCFICHLVIGRIGDPRVTLNAKELPRQHCRASKDKAHADNGSPAYLPVDHGPRPAPRQPRRALRTRRTRARARQLQHRRRPERPARDPGQVQRHRDRGHPPHPGLPAQQLKTREATEGA